MGIENKSEESNIPRIKVEVNVCDIDTDGKFDFSYIESEYNKILNKHPEYFDFKLDIDSGYIEVYANRWETDKEYETRSAKFLKAKTNKEERERKLYESLKEKFEK